MVLLSQILYIVHVIALTLAAGIAFLKLLLVSRCKRDYTRYPDYFKLAPLLSKLIIIGMVMLTLSGITWIIIGYSLELLLIVKIVIVVGIWIIGPVIDSRAEPRVKKFYPSPGAEPTAAFIRAQKQHLLLEIIATIMMYTALIIGVLL